MQGYRGHHRTAALNSSNSAAAATSGISLNSMGARAGLNAAAPLLSAPLPLAPAKPSRASRCWHRHGTLIACQQQQQHGLTDNIAGGAWNMAQNIDNRQFSGSRQNDAVRIWVRHRAALRCAGFKTTASWCAGSAAAHSDSNIIALTLRQQRALVAPRHKSSAQTASWIINATPPYGT